MKFCVTFEVKRVAIELFTIDADDAASAEKVARQQLCEDRTVVASTVESVYEFGQPKMPWEP